MANRAPSVSEDRKGVGEVGVAGNPRVEITALVPVHLVGDQMYKALYEEIPTIPTPIQKLSQSLQDFPFDKVLTNLASITEGLDKLVNSPELNQSITALRQTLDELNSLVAKLDAAVEPLASNAGGMMDEASVTLRNLNMAVDDAKQAFRQADRTLESADTLVRNDQVVTQIEQTLTAISNAARSIQLLAEAIERRPEILIRGRQSPAR